MSVIRAEFLRTVNENTLLKDISFSLDKLPRHSLQIAPWADYPYKPGVSFVIAYTDSSILLKYYVSEYAIRGAHSSSNMPVYEDSCVEFFISFNNQDAYYNLEINCIGTCLFAYGKERENRVEIPVETIGKIRRSAIIEHIENTGHGQVNWEMVVAIPVEVFIHDQITDLKGMHCKTNLYKCGDQLPHPHFLAWNNIIATAPDFHLPEYFGNIHFV